jgi:septum site-determining protein MinD
MLAIAGGKGGAGKTTTALGLASALDGPALVADVDRDMPDLHLLAGVDREPTLAAVGDGTPPTALAHPRPAADGVSVLPAPQADEDAAVGTALDRLARCPVTTLLDCPGGAGPDAARALRAAGAAVVVSPPCAPALRDAAKTAAMARAVGTTVAGAVLTRTRIRPDAAADLLGCPVLGAIPDADPPVLRRDAVTSAYDRVADAL